MAKITQYHFSIQTKLFGKVEIIDSTNDNKAFLFVDRKLISDAIIDINRNMHASFVYDDLKDDEVYLEWLDCYSNALLSKHKLEDVYNLNKLEEVLKDGYEQVVKQGFGVDNWE